MAVATKRVFREKFPTSASLIIPYSAPLPLVSASNSASLFANASRICDTSRLRYVLCPESGAIFREKHASSQPLYGHLGAPKLCHAKCLFCHSCISEWGFAKTPSRYLCRRGCLLNIGRPHNLAQWSFASLWLSLLFYFFLILFHIWYTPFAINTIAPTIFPIFTWTRICPRAWRSLSSSMAGKVYFLDILILPGVFLS